MNIQEMISQANLQIDKSKVLYNEPMSKHTTFKIGGPAECFIKIDKIEDLQQILKFSIDNNIKLTVIGNGSNLLVLDNGIKGITLYIDFKGIDVKKDKNDYILNVASGERLSKVARMMSKEEISGLEELSGIPGTIGGAVTMNAGAHGREMKDIVTNVKCMDYKGNIIDIPNDRMRFEYRNSILKIEKYIVLSVEMRLQQGNKEQIQKKIEEYSKYRKEKQPIEFPSAGSVFKRGNNFITAKLIDEAGLKGYVVGGAEVSKKHCGFIINKGDATAKDVLELVEYIKKKVYAEFGKKIELEIEVIGEL